MIRGYHVYFCTYIPRIYVPGVYKIVIFQHVRYNILAELHADLFSRHVIPLEVYVIVAVANRGEEIMSDEICRRFSGKQQHKRRSGRSVCSSQTGL